MAIRERKNAKSKVYEVYFTYKDVNNITHRYSKSGFCSKKLAREHEVKMKAEYLRNGDLVSNNRKTFNEVFIDYMKVEGSMKYAPSTLKYYWTTFNTYIKNSVGQNEIFSLQYKQLQMYFNDISKLGNPTIHNITKIFKVTYKYALKLSYIPSNPMLMVNIRYSLNNKEDKIQEISLEQFRDLCKCTLELSSRAPDKELNEWNNFNYFIALQIGWNLGLRISETLALHKTDFDFENNRVHIHRRVEYHGKKKADMYITNRMKTSGSKKYLPIALPLKELLVAWFRDNPYDLVVCDINGRLIHPSTISSRIRTAGKKIGIDFHYHMLRHSLASRLVRNDINPNVVKELMRHSKVSTTLEIYTHTNEEDERKAISKVFET